jgi:hypothetical protein
VPFELRVLPRRHESAFEAITPDEVADLARVLKRLTGLLVKAIGDPSYRLTLHTAPNLSVKIVQGEWDTIERDYHWHLESWSTRAGHVGRRDRRDRHASGGGPSHSSRGRLAGALGAESRGDPDEGPVTPSSVGSVNR